MYIKEYICKIYFTANLTKLILIKNKMYATFY